MTEKLFPLYLIENETQKWRLEAVFLDFTEWYTLSYNYYLSLFRLVGVGPRARVLLPRRRLA